jgi:hypothetical protein
MRRTLRKLESRLMLFAVCGALAAGALGACTTSDSTNTTGHAGTGVAGTSTSGTAGTGAAGTSASGTAGTGAAGTSASGAAGTGAAGTSASGTAGTGAAGTSTTGTAGTTPATDGGAGTGAAGTSVSSDGGLGKIPTCVSNDVAGAIDRVKTNYSECDVEGQAIDFDVAADYVAADYGGGRVFMPGYDPATSPVTFSSYGTAFSGAAVQSCHPYCYKQNLTIGVDFVPGTDKGLRAEAMFAFPPTVAPIVAPAGRASLGWIYLDGPALPAGAMVTAQMLLQSTDKGLLVAMETKQVTLNKWVEFRYFPIQQSFNVADLVNITQIGFRLTMATAGAAEWHGVIYADHFQLRK